MLKASFFNRDAIELAKALLGKVIRVKHRRLWLSVQIVETEAYYIREKGSHSSLGYTEKRKALFMPSGTIYMYFARGSASFNVSARGEGNAVLIKAGRPFVDEGNSRKMIEVMQRLNPHKYRSEPRSIERLCAGQTLLCHSLGLKVPDWDQCQFDLNRFYIHDVGYQPETIIQTVRLGIPAGRDEHLPYRFVDETYANSATKKPSYKKPRS